MVNKYEKFYLSVINFLEKLNLPTQIRGNYEQEIWDLEQMFDIKIPKSIRIYLRYFGQQISLYNGNQLQDALTFPKLNYALKVYRETEKFKIIENQWCKVKSIDFLPLIYAPDDDFLYFVNYRDENGKWYRSYDTEEVDTVYQEQITIIEHLRNLVKREVRAMVKKNLLDFKDIEWLNFHVINKSLLMDDSRYASIVREEEDFKGYFIDYEAYEIGFVEYLKNNNKTKPFN